MIAESTRAADPAALAAEVRSLAPTAHRLLAGSGPALAEVRATLGRVRCLHTHYRGHPDAELPRWLAGLHRRLSALVAPVGPRVAPAAGAQWPGASPDAGGVTDPRS